MKGFRKFALLLAAGTAWAGESAVLSNGFAIRHHHHAVLNRVTRLYLGPGNDSFVDVPTAEIARFENETTPVHPLDTSEAPNRNVAAIVSAVSARHQLDSDFISSVIDAESGFNPRAISPKGAQGLMQLMPGTASKLGVEDPFDPAANVDGGTHYLRYLLDYYQGDMAKTLAAYNAGPQRVAQYNGVPPYRETRTYVGRVIREFNRKKQVSGLQPKRESKSKTFRSPEPKTGLDTRRNLNRGKIRQAPSQNKSSKIVF